MNLLDRVKAKLQPTIQGVGNFLDQTRQNRVQQQAIAQQRNQQIQQQQAQQRAQRQQFLQQQADLVKKKVQNVLFNRQQEQLAKGILAQEGLNRRKTQIDDILNKANNFFAPVPDKVRPRDVIREGLDKKMKRDYEKYQQAQQKRQNFVGNVKTLANPQTRGDWLRGAGESVRLGTQPIINKAETVADFRHVYRPAPQEVKDFHRQRLVDKGKATLTDRGRIIPTLKGAGDVGTIGLTALGLPQVTMAGLGVTSLLGAGMASKPGQDPIANITKSITDYPKYLGASLLINPTANYLIDKSKFLQSISQKGIQEAQTQLIQSGRNAVLNYATKLAGREAVKAPAVTAVLSIFDALDKDIGYFEAFGDRFLSDLLFRSVVSFASGVFGGAKIQQLSTQEADQLKSDLANMLGINKEASPEEYKKAWRDFAIKYHPDRYKEGEEKFKAVNDLFQKLEKNFGIDVRSRQTSSQNIPTQPQTPTQLSSQVQSSQQPSANLPAIVNKPFFQVPSIQAPFSGDTSLQLNQEKIFPSANLTVGSNQAQLTNQPIQQPQLPIVKPEIIQPEVKTPELPEGKAQVDVKSATLKANQPKSLDDVLASKEITTPIKPPVDTQPINTINQVQQAKQPQTIDEILKPKSKLKVIFEDTALPSKTVLAKAGVKGQEAVNLINKTQETIDLTAGNYIAKLKPAIDKLSVQEKLSLADVIEGKQPAISETQEQAVKLWKEVSGDIYNNAKKVNLETNFIKDYFPHHVILENKQTTQAGQGLSRTAQRRYGNLEMARQTDQPFDKDPSVLYDYIRNAVKRIEEVKNYGASDEKLYQLAQKTRDPQQAMKYIDQILGKHEPSDQVGRAIRNWQTFKLKPTTSLTNLTQNISTLLRTDPKSVISGIKNTLKNPEEAILNAIKAGELQANSARVFEDYSGSGSLASKWIHLIGMEGTEKVNRIIAVNSAMDYFKKLNKQALNGSQAALREIKRLGMEVNDNPIKAGRKISQETQFSTTPGELPYNWKTSLGKVLTQFKSFAYKQTGFIKNQAVRVGQEAVKGNFKPLITALLAFGVTAPIVGEVVADAKALLTNKKRDKKGIQRYFDNILAASSFGLLDDLGALTGRYGEKGVVSGLFGPTASDVMSIAEITATIGDENKYEQRKAYRDLLRFIPGVGTTLANTLVPNAYVDNFLGQNVGLSEKDRQTYLNMKSIDPQKAEEFKIKQQSTRDKENQSEGNWLSNLFNKQPEYDWNFQPTNKEEATEFKNMLIDSFEAGVAPPKEAISNGLFSGKSAQSEEYSDRKDVYSTLYTTLNDEDFPYSEEVQKAIIEAAGASMEEYEYYAKTKLDQTERLEIMINEMGDLSDPDNFKQLMLMKMKVGGNEMLSDQMVNYLYEFDYISKEQKKLLQNLEYDEITREFYFKKSYTGAGGSGGSSQSKKKLVYQSPLSKGSYLSMVNAINSIFEAAQGKVPTIQELLAINNPRAGSVSMKPPADLNKKSTKHLEMLLG